MLNKKSETDEPSSTSPAIHNGGENNNSKNYGLFKSIRTLFVKPKNGSDTLREALEEYMSK